MKTLEIKKLAEKSFTNENLDIKKIKKITPLLGRKQLKVYIKFLKKLENIRTVWVFTPINNIEKEIIDKLKSMFPRKRIEYITDSSLIAGLRIIDNDMVYELNLKDSLDGLITYLKRSYD